MLSQTGSRDSGSIIFYFKICSSGIGKTGKAYVMLLLDLLEVEKFSDGADACISEARLWERYGKQETVQAIDSGLLEHRRIKFRDGYGRCVCWLSDKGRKVAEAETELST